MTKKNEPPHIPNLFKEIPQKPIIKLLLWGALILGTGIIFGLVISYCSILKYQNDCQDDYHNENFIEEKTD